MSKIERNEKRWKRIVIGKRSFIVLDALSALSFYVTVCIVLCCVVLCCVEVNIDL